NYIIASNNPYRIFINLDEQLMYVFKNDELYKTYPVSGGKTNSPSPVGEWIIIEKGNWGDGFGGAWMGLNVPWGKYGIHGTRQPWAIGRQNISGGCIRMKNEDANELYEFIPYGTKVKIVYENQPFRNIRDGDIGSDVYEVQKALKYLNYFHDWCDGKYGPATKKAVMAFQKDEKLAVTGIVNISTWERLMRKYNEAMLE
ncbi:MAG: L,D-transpeptidase family protein, partial [Clostridiaceae bacterium]|nr:L,D-transpeptidase family protein [Clostridiaceae bacterium]